MTHAWTYETATSFWTRTRANPEGAWDGFASAERFLLDHKPRTLGEAAQIVAVLVDQCGDPRSDGRDLEALGRLRRYLQQLDRFEAPPVTLAVRAVA
ncbi:MAG: hypothetical protein K0M78_12220 [Brevundimonas sp.]|nr:hypothetical protein [Brevundimonas sp.]